MSEISLAIANLRRVVKVLNMQDVTGEVGELAFALDTYAGRFVVRAGFVTKTCDPRLWGPATCYYLCSRSRVIQGDDLDIPVPERIATAALLLHHNPAIFERWLEHYGYHA